MTSLNRLDPPVLKKDPSDEIFISIPPSSPSSIRSHSFSMDSPSSETNFADNGFTNQNVAQTARAINELFTHSPPLPPNLHSANGIASSQPFDFPYYVPYPFFTGAFYPKVPQIAQNIDQFLFPAPTDSGIQIPAQPLCHPTPQPATLDEIDTQTPKIKIRLGPRPGVNKPCSICNKIILKKSYPKSQTNKLERICISCKSRIYVIGRKAKLLAEGKTCLKCQSPQIVKLWLKNKDVSTKDAIPRTCDKCYRKHRKLMKNFITNTESLYDGTN